ncbi:MAG: TolC family protein [Campylobacteraceae bacterium]|nr:TolC family protein [Campylobacteraceae bacterium]
MKKIGLLLCFQLFLSAGNLSELVDLALGNKLIESSKYTLEAAKDKSSAITTSYMPSLSIGANASFNQEETMTSPDKSTTSYARLSFTLYDGGKRGALMEQQEALVKNASFTLQSVQNDVVLKVVYYYYSYLSALSSKESIEQKLGQLNAERYRLEKFLLVGSATGDEIQKIISSIEQAKIQLLQTEVLINNIFNTLEYLTNQSVSIQSGSTLTLKESSEATRYDILALEAMTHTAKAQATIAKAPSLPTIALEDTYSRFDNDYKQLNDSGFDRQNTLMLTAQWKIFDFGSTSSSYESAHKEYLSKTSQLAYEKSKAKASLKSAQNSYDIALRKIEASKERVKAADMTYDLVQKKFQNGIVNNVAYLDALSDKYNAKSELETSINDVEYQKAVVLYEMGKEIKGSIQ